MLFRRTVLATAVLAASGVAVAADGYEFSGHTARSQALQLDYFAGHQDSGDIWVNPALIGKYGNRVQLNADNRNNNGNGDGGVFLQTGANIFGIYIGRDGNQEFAGNIDESYERINGDDLGTDYGIQQTNPQSQFDLFYAFDTDALAIGARLNYQDNEQNDSGAPYVSGIPGGFSSIDAWLDHQKATYAAATANNSSAPSFPAINQTFQPTTSADAWAYDASEINLSIGFELKALNIDGALLFGKANGKFKLHEAYFRENVTLNDNAGEQERWVNSSERGAMTDTYELDGGDTFGLALRSQVFDRDNSKLTLSFAYLDQDYSAKSTYINDSSEQIFDGTVDAELAETYTDSYLDNSKVKDEREAYQLSGAFEKRLDDNTRLTVFTGFNHLEIKSGYSYDWTVDSSYYEDHVADQFEYTYSNVGPQDHETRTDKYTRIPLVIAAEHSFNERWVGRASVSRDLYRNHKHSANDDEFNANLIADAIDPPAVGDQDQTTQSGSNRFVYTNSRKDKDEESWVNQPTTLMVGLGYTLGNFTIDTVLGKDFFTEGFDQSGVFGAASLRYNF